MEKLLERSEFLTSRLTGAQLEVQRCLARACACISSPAVLVQRSLDKPQTDVVQPSLPQVRNILTNPTWEEAYGLVIPVLTVAAPDGSREVRHRLPRLAMSMAAHVLGLHQGMQSATCPAQHSLANGYECAFSAWADEGPEAFAKGINRAIGKTHRRHTGRMGPSTAHSVNASARKTRGISSPALLPAYIIRKPVAKVLPSIEAGYVMN